MTVRRALPVLAAALALLPLPALAADPGPGAAPRFGVARFGAGDVIRCSCRIAATGATVVAAAVQVRVPGTEHRLPLPAHLALHLPFGAGVELSARLGSGYLAAPVRVELTRSAQASLTG